MSPYPYRDRPSPPLEPRERSRRIEDLELVPVYLIAWFASLAGLVVARESPAIVPVVVLPTLVWGMLRRH